MVGTVISADMDLIGQRQPNTPEVLKVEMIRPLCGSQMRADLLAQPCLLITAAESSDGISALIGGGASQASGFSLGMFFHWNPNPRSTPYELSVRGAGLRPKLHDAVCAYRQGELTRGTVGTFAVAHSRPPWASISERQIESPIPMPLDLVGERRRLNSRSSFSQRSRTPRSVHLRALVFSSLADRITSAALPIRTVLHASCHSSPG